MAKLNYVFEEPHDIKTWWIQILFWRTHLDVFIVNVLGINLKDDQRVIARAVGNCVDSKYVANRGQGKSWLVAAICYALAILYPYTPIGVVSATAQQATIVLRKMQSFIELYPAILPNINIVGREPVVISKDKGVVRIKNGSKVESYSTASIVGERLKIICVDEAWRVHPHTLKQNVLPTANYTRDVCLQNGYSDFNSKTISFTSACRKSNYFYKDFVETYNNMQSGNKTRFACALDWHAAVRMGITKQAYFEQQMRELPDSIFATEYGANFIGEEDGSVFPYELTDSCRKLKKVEYSMPRASNSYYIISVDLATSSAKGSDNAVICVIKCNDKEDGTILKQLVYIRSYNGRRLDELADEVRRTFVRFPNTTKVVFDQRGLGDSFPAFFDTPWVDPDTDREYPSWTLDTEIQHNAQPMLHSFKANIQLNQELVTALRVALEQKTLSFPVDSRTLDEALSDGGESLKKEELAIYIETDALQVEMSNLVMKTSSTTGNVTYDSAKSNQHKDRYSSLAMGIWYISKIEAEHKRIYAARQRGSGFIGVVSYF